ncbi:MAG: transketolase family protein [Christensenellales bacterium]|jgi:transketolase
MIAIREAYGKALLSLGGRNDKVVALEADVGMSTRSVLFGQAYPDRYFNVGIAENNMVAIAAGFARSGFIPFVNTFAAFMIGRGGDPIQSLIAYDRLNVKLAGTYCGMSDSYDGASHHAIADLAYVRALPNMTIVVPSDPEQTRQAVYAIAEHQGPVYLRLSRAPAPRIYPDNYRFELGKGYVHRQGTDVTIIACGQQVHEALKAASILSSHGISAQVIDIATIKPLDEDLILACAKKTGHVVTAEEHSVHGGLGSAVSELLSSRCPTKMAFVGMKSFAESGSYNQLLAKYGVDASSIETACRRVLKRQDPLSMCEKGII